MVPQHIRGAVVSTYGLAIDFGLLSSLIISFACDRDWRLMLGLAAVPALLQLIFLIFVPETPRHLAKNEKNDECYKVLLNIYPEKEAQN